MFNEADFKCAVLEIMTGAKKGPDGEFPVLQKLRDQLERSSTEIFPFFEACSRNSIKYVNAVHSVLHGYGPYHMAVDMEF